MKKKNTGLKNSDEKNQDDAIEETCPAEDSQHAENDNHIRVNVTGKPDIKEGERTNQEVPDNEDDPVARLKEALAIAEKEKAEINDRLLRAAADFDNQKKRLDRQWIDFKKYANESLARELLTVVDNLERAIAASSENTKDSDKLVEGVQMTLDEILKILERFDITPIKAVGEKFDPNYHQAVSTRPAEDVEEKIVLEEYQKGYLIHDRLLRPAMVVVSAAKQ